MNKFPRSEQFIKSFERGNQPQMHLFSLIFFPIWKNNNSSLCYALWFMLGIQSWMKTAYWEDNITWLKSEEKPVQNCHPHGAVQELCKPVLWDLGCSWRSDVQFWGSSARVEIQKGLVECSRLWRDCLCRICWSGGSLGGEEAEGRVCDGVWRAAGTLTGKLERLWGWWGLATVHCGCLCPRASLTVESDSQILVLPHILTLPEIFNIKTEVKLDKISGVTSLGCHCTSHGGSQIIGLCCPLSPGSCSSTLSAGKPSTCEHQKSRIIWKSA